MGNIWDDLDTLSHSDDVYGKVVGVTFVNGYPDNLISLQKSVTEKGLQATIRRNPNNKYDTNACEVWVDEEFIGHLPRDIAEEVAPQIDKGIGTELTITSIGFANDDPTKPGAGFRLKLIK